MVYSDLPTNDYNKRVNSRPQCFLARRFDVLQRLVPEVGVIQLSVMAFKLQ
jgi:hypothetical protein